MPDITKLLCNVCYQPLETVTYPEGVYVEPCDCHIEILEKKFRLELEEAEHKAYREGEWDGEESAMDELSYRIDELEKEVSDLEEKLEVYQSDDDYNERIGV